MLEQILQEIAADPFYQANFPNDGQRFVAWYLRRVLLRDDAAHVTILLTELTTSRSMQ